MFTMQIRDIDIAQGSIEKINTTRSLKLNELIRSASDSILSMMRRSHSSEMRIFKKEILPIVIDIKIMIVFKTANVFGNLARLMIICREIQTSAFRLDSPLGELDRVETSDCERRDVFTFHKARRDHTLWLTGIRLGNAVFARSQLFLCETENPNLTRISPSFWTEDFPNSEALPRFGLTSLFTECVLKVPSFSSIFEVYYVGDLGLKH